MADVDSRKFAVEKYLDQVKILTALATTLLLTPNVLLTLAAADDTRRALDSAFPTWRTVLLHTNVSFLVTIGMTYFIYSSIVGRAEKGQFDVNRPLTRIFSLLQFGALCYGCVGLVRLFTAAAA